MRGYQIDEDNYQATFNPKDPEHLEELRINGYLAMLIEVYKDSGRKNRRLLELFQEDFEEFTIDIFRHRQSSRTAEVPGDTSCARSLRQASKRCIIRKSPIRLLHCRGSSRMDQRRYSRTTGTYWRETRNNTHAISTSRTVSHTSAAAATSFASSEYCPSEHYAYAEHCPSANRHTSPE